MLVFSWKLISRTPILISILSVLSAIAIAFILLWPRALSLAEEITVNHAVVDLDVRSPSIAISGQAFDSESQVFMGPVDGMLEQLSVLTSSTKSITAKLPFSLATQGKFLLTIVDPSTKTGTRDDDKSMVGARRSATAKIIVGPVEELSDRQKNWPPGSVGISANGSIVTLLHPVEINSSGDQIVLDASFLDRIDRPLTLNELQHLSFVEADEDWVQTKGGPFPFGQKRLTTPWPKVNGSRDPVCLAKPIKTSASIEWDTQEIIDAKQIEYEIMFGSNFTKLDGDQSGAIASGILKSTKGSIILDFASFGKGPGTFYIRVAAQDAFGADVAYRSQPVKVVVEPKECTPVLVGKPTNILTVNYFTWIKHGHAKGVTVTSEPQSFPEGPPFIQWSTSPKACVKARLEVVEGDFIAGSSVLYSEIGAGSVYAYSHIEPGIHRWGRFDLKPVYQKLLAANNKSGQKYALRIVPLDAQSKKCGAAADALYLQYFQSFRKSIESVMINGQSLVGMPNGSIVAPPIKKGYHTVTPDFNCWKDNTKVFISFNQEMDEASVEKAISISPPWPDLVAKWYPKGSKITAGSIHTIGIGHMSNLWFDTVYTITLGTGAKTKSGKKILQTPVRWRFKTLPFADKMPLIEKIDYSKIVTIPNGEMTIAYAFNNVHRAGIDLGYVFHTQIPQSLIAAKETVKVLRLDPAYDPAKGAHISVIYGNALAILGEHYPFKVNVVPPVKTDLAISAANLIPGKSSTDKIHINPYVEITNNGPGSLSKDVLPFVKVGVLYRVSPPFCSGTWCKWSARKVMAEATMKGCKAPFKKGHSCKLTPTSWELPKGKFNKPVRLYGAEARLSSAANSHYYTAQIDDDSQKNNDYIFDPANPIDVLP